MNYKNPRIALLLASSLAAATAGADYLAPDPGTQISLQYNSNGAIVVRPVGGVWTHPLCPDVTAAVLTPSYFGGTVWQLLIQAAMNGRSVNLRVSDTECHANGYPLIESLRIFP